MLELNNLHIRKEGWQPPYRWATTIVLVEEGKGSGKMKEVKLDLDSALSQKLVAFLNPILQAESAKAARELYEQSLLTAEKTAKAIEDSLDKPEAK